MWLVIRYSFVIRVGSNGRTPAPWFWCVILNLPRLFPSVVAVACINEDYDEKNGKDDHYNQLYCIQMLRASIATILGVQRRDCQPKSRLLCIRCNEACDESGQCGSRAYVETRDWVETWVRKSRGIVRAVPKEFLCILGLVAQFGRSKLLTRTATSRAGIHGTASEERGLCSRTSVPCNIDIVIDTRLGKNVSPVCFVEARWVEVLIGTESLSCSAGVDAATADEANWIGATDVE